MLVDWHLMSSVLEEKMRRPTRLAQKQRENEGRRIETAWTC